jgi:hypothetical protein
LVELWCAQRFHVPIVVCTVAMRGFEWPSACDALSDLDATFADEPDAAQNLVASIQDVLLCSTT